jgi:hypothetical protein
VRVRSFEGLFAQFQAPGEDYGRILSRGGRVVTNATRTACLLGAVPTGQENVGVRSEGYLLPPSEAIDLVYFSSALFLRKRWKQSWAAPSVNVADISK